MSGPVPFKWTEGSLESLHNSGLTGQGRTDPIPIIAQAYIKLCNPATFFMIGVCLLTRFRYRSAAILHTSILPIPCFAGRVGRGGCPPRPPTDPGMPN